MRSSASALDDVTLGADLHEELFSAETRFPLDYFKQEPDSFDLLVPEVAQPEAGQPTSLLPATPSEFVVRGHEDQVLGSEHRPEVAADCRVLGTRAEDIDDEPDLVNRSQLVNDEDDDVLIDQKVEHRSSVSASTPTVIFGTGSISTERVFDHESGGDS